MENRFFNLPLSFDPGLLQSDLKTCEEHNWKDHFNSKDYIGQWTSISLRSLSGRSTDIYAHEGGIYKNTELAERCPYFTAVMDSFGCSLDAVRLLALAPGSEIKEHTDAGCGYQYGVFRIHIPVVTSSGVSFYVDGLPVMMNEGECWYADFSLPHYCRNTGEKTRVHLVIDGQRNSLTDEVFQKAGYNFENENLNIKGAHHPLDRIIEELESLGTETSRRLIEELKSNSR